MLEKVRFLVDMGASVILLHPREKRPIDNGWSEAPVLSWKELKAVYRPGMNFGLRPGKWSKVGGLFLHVIDLDIRDPDAADEADEALEAIFTKKVWKLPRVISGSGGQSRHIYFLSKTPLPSRNLAKSKVLVKGQDGKSHRAWEIDLVASKKQVVLPPSIHPITGKPYRWEVEFDPTSELPTMPEDGLEAILFPAEERREHDAEKLDLTREQVEDMLQWLDLDQWCETYEGWRNLGMALHHQFDGSEEGFDLWCKFSKQSPKYSFKQQKIHWRSYKDRTDRPVTMRSIVKAANEGQRDAEYRALPGEFEDIDEDEDLEPEITATADDFEDLDLPKSEKSAVPGVPKHLLSVPGELQKVVDYYNATAMKDQPQFAVQTALAFGSLILGRVWKTDFDNFSSLYFLNIGPTASGKEHANRVVDRLLEASSLSHYMGPKSYTSESGVISTLMEKPKHITIIDELGRLLKTVRDSQGSQKQEAQTALMEVFGRLDGTARSIGYSTHGKTKEQIEQDNNRFVVRPALTLLAMTTPDTLFKALGGMDVKDGFLNRFLIVESPLGRQLSREDAPRADVPKSLADWARITALSHGGDEEDGVRMLDPQSKFIPVPVTVPFSKDCKPILREMEEDVIAEMNRLDDYGMAELYGRTREIAMRLSLIVAVSCNSKTVKREHLEWARDYVFFYHRKMADRFKTSLGKSEDEGIAEEIVAFLKKQGSKGALPSDFVKYCRAYRVLERRRREEILDRMQSDYGVKHVTSEGKGPKSKRYFAPKR